MATHSSTLARKIPWTVAKGQTLLRDFTFTFTFMAILPPL